MPKYPTLTKPISRAGIVEIYETLGNIKGAFNNPMHSWTAASLRTKIKELVEPINETKADVEKKKPTEYLEAHNLLVRAFAKLDEEGRPMASQNQYVLDPERRSQFETEALALREKHKPSIDAYEAEIKKTNEFLRAKQEVTFPDMRLKLSWFNATVSQEAFEILMDLIEVDVDLGAETPAAPSSASDAPVRTNRSARASAMTGSRSAACAVVRRARNRPACAG